MLAAGAILEQIAYDVILDHATVDCNLIAHWIASIYEELSSNKCMEIILSGFRRAGILDAINGTLPFHTNPFTNLS